MPHIRAAQPDIIVQALRDQFWLAATLIMVGLVSCPVDVENRSSKSPATQEFNNS